MRKLYYLKPKIQYAFTRYSTFLSAFEILIFGILIFLLEGLDVQHPTDLQIYIRFSVILLFILIFTAFNFWLSIRFSHRIVGPMIQIHRTLDQAINGNCNLRIRLRSDDLMFEISDRINTLLEKIERENRK